MLESTRSPRYPRLCAVPVAAWMAALLLSAPLLAGAAVTVRFTSFDLPDVGGQHFRAYDYVISGGFADGDTLTLEFPTVAYGDPITVLRGPATATLTVSPVIQPDAVMNASGLLMLTAFMPPATFQDTLQVSFLSLAAPGVQPFEVADGNSGLVVQRGFTVSAAAAAVPEPPAGALFAAGLALLTVLRRSPFSRSRSRH